MQEKAYIWNGKVGLINALDYVKSSNASSCSSGINNYSRSSWLNLELSNTINPQATFYGYHLWNVDGNHIQRGWAHDEHKVYPVMFLTSEIQLKGSGSEQNPYIIK